MKKFVYTSFVAFWASIGTLVTVHALSSDESASGQETDQSTTTEVVLPGYTLAQVAEHSTLEDCWMAMEGKVYDFSDYIPKHPTPSAIMEAWCGKEATEGMRTKGYGRDHSEAAWQMAEAYLIGTVQDE